MATLILTAVGTAIGGPIGGAIGAIIGQRADQAIFAPKPRHGPRLGELSVQTSSYGGAIPKIFGIMRVAGTVVWATDLIESRSTAGGGKGRPKTVNYSYSANFAVALSGREVLEVRRIWADGKLLRGAAGDFKTGTNFRFHPGDEDQPADPLIAAAEGIDQTPGFRGTAYAVFEDFQLEDYGNRIPSLTFELVADEGPVSIGAIAEELGGGEVKAGDTPSVHGYAASGDSVRGAIAALSDVVPLSLTDREEGLLITGAADPPTPISTQELSGRIETVRRATNSIPAETSIAYYDIDRDFQTGLQRATTGTAGGTRRSDRLSLPAALSSAEAKGFCERRLRSLLEGRVSAKGIVGWRRLGLRAGDRVRIGERPEQWRIERCTIGPMTHRLELVRVSGEPVPASIPAAPGRAVAQPDLPHGPTELRLCEIPASGEQPLQRPLAHVLAAGILPGWRRADLTVSFDGGESWQSFGPTAAPAVIGTVLTVPPAGTSALFDRNSSLEIELLNDSMWLESRSDGALIGGANAALCGREIIQFGDALPLGGGRFRLARLLRGRRGTEWAMPLHLAGESFALLDPTSMAAIEAPVAALGAEIRVMAAGIGDGEGPAEAVLTMSGESLRPPSPVHLTGRRQPNGDVVIAWVRRSRLGWSWGPGGDSPLGEEAELYRLTIAGEGLEKSLVLATPAWTYSAAEQAGDGATGELTVQVAQLGNFGPSRPASTTFQTT